MTDPAPTPAEALRRLFDLLDRLDRRADNPGPRHMIEVTSELWKDQIRPQIKVVRAALASQPAADTLDAERLAEAMEGLAQSERLIIQTVHLLPAKDGSSVHVKPGTYDELAGRIASAYRDAKGTP